MFPLLLLLHIGACCCHTHYDINIYEFVWYQQWHIHIYIHIILIYICNSLHSRPCWVWELALSPQGSLLPSWPNAGGSHGGCGSHPMDDCCVLCFVFFKHATTFRLGISRYQVLIIVFCCLDWLLYVVLFGHFFRSCSIDYICIQ